MEGCRVWRASNTVLTVCFGETGGQEGCPQGHLGHRAPQGPHLGHLPPVRSHALLHLGGRERGGEAGEVLSGS